ncbi:TIGR02452 family protein [Leeia aquatica]|uniref:TIGR02452 family protein n=1 Tax=Leeia aquatica TaxID=2725557 RepID=A0A847S447_9NEIS|nr:TIGR02452 family protein [Leeia aquatica]NLR74573.1 TIGR02452 family protein [Leeia aquatica]
MNRENRARIAQHTLEILEQGCYHNSHGQMVDLAEAQDAARMHTQHYRSAELAQLHHRQLGVGTEPTVIGVHNESTLAAARRLLHAGHHRVLCLNFASARNPGGGFLGGAEAQEENLAKSSGLYPCLLAQKAFYEANRQQRFCAYLDDMIYSPDVPVFRDDSYACLEQYYLVSMVTAPAVNRGAVLQHEPRRVAELEDIMRLRIRKLFALALHHQHDTLVLGAWGCGVFGNAPADMARWFAEALLGQGDYAGRFKHIEFAVLDRRNNGTYTAFAQQFGGQHHMDE